MALIISDRNQQTNQTSHLQLEFCYSFRLMRDWQKENLANGKDISIVSFQTGKEDHLWRYSVISERIFRKVTVPIDFQPKSPDILAKW